jgi:hypothetical protein
MLSGNAFDAPPSDGPSIRGFNRNQLETLPAATAADYVPGPNWFANPDAAAFGFSPAAWPAELLGSLLSERPSGAGSR